MRYKDGKARPRGCLIMVMISCAARKYWPELRTAIDHCVRSEEKKKCIFISLFDCGNYFVIRRPDDGSIVHVKRLFFGLSSVVPWYDCLDELICGIRRGDAAGRRKE